VSLTLVDVCGGSETPSLVRHVLGWRDKAEAALLAANKDADAAVVADLTREIEAATADSEERAAMVHAAAAARGPALWRRLAAENARVAVLCARLKALGDKPACAEGGDAYGAVLERLSFLPAAKWTEAEAQAVAGAEAQAVAAGFLHLRDAMAHCRRFLRQMGEAAGVPIEPIEQTLLADSTLAAPGVLAVGVPGAGGYDAIFALIVHGSEARAKACREAVEKVWLDWPGGGLTPLLLRNGSARGEANAGVVVTRN
jgi:phosphomevalonate kinase